MLGICGSISTRPRGLANPADANHRCTTDRAMRDQIVAQGWLAEGDGQDHVVVCAPCRYGTGWSGVSTIETALMISLLGWMSGGESGPKAIVIASEMPVVIS
jgi:hypothetical protein